jgi:inhibitor of the pro-sigma K processing machinery
MMRFIKWFLKSILFGIVLIFIFNIIGVYFNLNIPVNVWTILIVGVLKVPGLIMILILSII